MPAMISFITFTRSSVWMAVFLLLKIYRERHDVKTNHKLGVVLGEGIAKGKHECQCSIPILLCDKTGVYKPV